MKLHDLLQKHTNTNTVKYVMPLININTKNANATTNANIKSLCKILNINTDLDYDFDQQVAQEISNEKVSIENDIIIDNKNNKTKYITYFLISTLFLFPIYKLIIYK